ncbi:hypothetical protein [Microbacterium sp. CPCC 204701]|uniref:hypothetical protein n=1 Tax=Microbacterium sp. CPCC 204701 TaxID=2493084 RepID=UPI000FDA16FB|nr:hypothetical protein [Microbacterium sp. CPCC 204701]
MDPTLAALAGAALGAIATATVPFMTIHARRRDEAEDRRRADTVQLLDALIRLIKARNIGDWRLYSATHSEAAIALQKLILNAEPRDAKYLQQVGNFALESIGDQQNVALATVGVEALSLVLTRWCHGEIKGRRIADAYEPALETQFDRHESRRNRN